MSSQPMWLNGEIVAPETAGISPMNAAVKYGLAVFEGIRVYGGAVFRLLDHCRRLAESAALLSFEQTFEPDEYADAICDYVRELGGVRDLHLRVQLYVDDPAGLMDTRGPVSLCIAASPAGIYPRSTGRHAVVSSWSRISDDAMPPRIKSAANYVNSRLALLQAKRDGYDDAILLTRSGKVAEGPGYNVFLARNGELVTPDVTSGILEGITRDSVTVIARRLGIPVTERIVDRTELYVADEVFFTGTAAEIAPVLSVDKHPVGDEAPGKLTKALRDEYLAIARGDAAAPAGWITHVAATASVQDGTDSRPRRQQNQPDSPVKEGS